MQMHFYLLFPLMLWFAQPTRPGFRRRVAHGSLVLILSTSLLRWGAAHASGVKMPLPPYAHPDADPALGDVAVRYYHTLYFASPARIANFATGNILALLMMNKNVKTAVRKRWVVRGIGVGVAGVLLAASHLVIHSKPYGVSLKEQRAWRHSQAFAALAYHGSPLYCVAVAGIIMTTALRAGPLAQAAAWMSHTRLIKRLANVTYDVYLLHMVALYWMEAASLRLGEFVGGGGGVAGQCGAGCPVGGVRGGLGGHDGWWVCCWFNA